MLGDNAESAALRAILDGALTTMLGPDATFRPGQLEAVDAALSGRDCLAMLPTGAGKSLVYMLPAAMRVEADEPGVTVVVSPLLSLLRDQNKRCDELGLQCESWSSAVDADTLGKIEKDLRVSREDGGPATSLLFTTPEALCGNQKLRGALAVCHANSCVTGIAVDEAHCVSQWGHDFRPAYLRLAEIRDDLLKGTPISALTATATPEVANQIVDALGLRDVKVIRSPLNRPNLRYQVIRRECVGDGAGKGTETAAVQHLVQFAKDTVSAVSAQFQNQNQNNDDAGGPVGIVFARTRDECDRLANVLSESGMDCVSYHAGKPPECLARAQRCWSAGDIDAVVATVAFGMGVDKPNVRWVAHWGPPATLEGLYQESGRAGRDGDVAQCAMYVGSAELDALRKLGARGGDVEAYALDGKRCRRAAILKHFGERGATRGMTCGDNDTWCDVCSDPERVKREAKGADKKWEQKEEARAYDELELRMDAARAKAREREHEALVGKENGLEGGETANAKELSAKAKELPNASPQGTNPPLPRVLPGPQRAAAAKKANAASAASAAKTPEIQPVAPTSGKRKFVHPARPVADA